MSKLENHILSGRQRALLIACVLLMILPLPITYVMFLIPLAYVPVSIMALCVLMGAIKNKTAVITIEIIAVLSAISSCWILFILLNWLYLGN